jgi:hypothetical protein
MHNEMNHRTASEIAQSQALNKDAQDTAGWKLPVIYAEAAIFGTFAGIGMGTCFGWAGLAVAIPLSVLHVWCATAAHEHDTSNAALTGAPRVPSNGVVGAQP